MKVDLKNDPNKPEAEPQIAEPVVVPADEPQAGAIEPSAGEVAAQEAERVRQIELENAELRGKNSALESMRAASSTENPAKAQNAWKTTVLGDMNAMSDEDFRTKYKFEKYQATAAILEADFQASDTKNKQEIADLRAENRLVAKYGSSFMDVRAEVDEMVAMASPEIRQDPAKLEKFMEKAYLAAKSGVQPVKPAGKVDNMQQRRIVSMEKPTPQPAGGNRTEAKTDDLAPEYQKLGKAFNLTSEKERKELVESNYIPMDLGGGLVFRDPAKGVEKVGQPA